MRSLKFAIRTLFRTPFVTAIAILSLALGIGATAGIFSVFHQVLLQSLAVPNPSELVNLSAPGPKPGFQSCGRAGDCEVVFSYAMFRDWQKTQTVFTDIAAHVGFGANLAYEAQTSSGEGLLVSGSYFPVLELQPALAPVLWGVVRKVPAYTDPKVITEGMRRAETLMAILEAQLADKPFLAGERLGVADITVGCGVHRWLNMPVERIERPVAQRWYAALFARPAAQAALPLPIA